MKSKNKTKKTKPSYATTTKDAKFAGMIQRSAFRFLKQDLPKYIAEDGSYNMIQMVLQDCSNLMLLAESLELRGPCGKTFAMMCNLDTSVREEIPQTAYDYLCGN